MKRYVILFGLLLVLVLPATAQAAGSVSFFNYFVWVGNQNLTNGGVWRAWVDNATLIQSSNPPGDYVVTGIGFYAGPNNSVPWVEFGSESSPTGTAPYFWTNASGGWDCFYPMVRGFGGKGCVAATNTFGLGIDTPHYVLAEYFANPGEWQFYAYDIQGVYHGLAYLNAPTPTVYQENVHSAEVYTAALNPFYTWHALVSHPQGYQGNGYVDVLGASLVWFYGNIIDVLDCPNAYSVSQPTGDAQIIQYGTDIHLPGNCTATREW